MSSCCEVNGFVCQHRSGVTRLITCSDYSLVIRIGAILSSRGSKLLAYLELMELILSSSIDTETQDLGLVWNSRETFHPLLYSSEFSFKLLQLTISNHWVVLTLHLYNYIILVAP